MPSEEDLHEAAAIGQLNAELGPALAGQFRVHKAVRKRRP